MGYVEFVVGISAFLLMTVAGFLTPLPIGRSG